MKSLKIIKQEKYNKSSGAKLIQNDNIKIIKKNHIRKKNIINCKLLIYLIIILIVLIGFLVVYKFFPNITHEYKKIKDKELNIINEDKKRISINKKKNGPLLVNYIPLNKLEAVEKGKNFFNLCMNKELKNNKSFKKQDNPFISVIIPVYNVGDKISSAVYSARNQNVSDIEIILINDGSNTETSEIIKKLEKEDPRIILINNKENRGTLYSRCIGLLKSKGKYIFPLDSDDLFFDEDVLYVVSKVAIDGNFDIVEYKGAERYIFNVFSQSFRDSEYSNHVNNLELYQPELGQYARRRNNIIGIYDVFLWCKCIESNIYKKTVNTMGEEIYKYKMIWGEDLITSFVLLRIAQSFKFINKYGISRFKNKSTHSNNTSQQMFFLSVIIYIKTLLKFTENNFYDKQLLVHETISFIRWRKSLNDENKTILKELLKLILNNNYVTNNDKERIQRYAEYYMK